MNKSSRQIQDLFNDSKQPKGILLASKLAQYYRQTLTAKASRIFERADITLLAWWPNCQASLLSIYEQEFLMCWQHYDQVVTTDTASLETMQSLLSCLYVEFKILQVFERRLSPPRKVLPNDVNDIGATLLFDLYQDVIQHQDTQQQQMLNNWITQLTTLNWTQALQSL
ncbi:hypothetical protein MNBD_GAMMA22-825 [hydrothermal vent metagenome]|uniref:Uncharacterized protein n=1 Tax=hydrothermal vent metagenome TaxID=652676 RepID=A0A3B1APY3_9ZZZZ